MVIPWRMGMGNLPTKEVYSFERIFPSIWVPPMGFGDLEQRVFYID